VESSFEVQYQAWAFRLLINIDRVSLARLAGIRGLSLSNLSGWIALARDGVRSLLGG